jgi:hypothetical protein
MLARRAAKGDIGLLKAAKALQEELLAPPALPTESGGLFEDERRALDAMKKAALAVLGLAMQTYREALTDQQEILMHLADMLMDTFTAESAVLRATAAAGSAKASLHAAAARVLVNDGAMRVDASSRQALAAMVEGDVLRTTLAALRRLFRQMPVNTAALRRELAAATVERGGYPF